MGRMAYVCVEQCILNGFVFPYYILGKFPHNHRTFPFHIRCKLRTFA